MVHEYRAWNKIKKIMIYKNEEGPFVLLKCIGSHSNVVTVNSLLSDDSYEWLQYTGRKDVNSKKIYDADFIMRVYRRKDKEPFVGRVKFYNGRWVIWILNVHW